MDAEEGVCGVGSRQARRYLPHQLQGVADGIQARRVEAPSLRAWRSAATIPTIERCSSFSASELLADKASGTGRSENTGQVEAGRGVEEVDISAKSGCVVAAVSGVGRPHFSDIVFANEVCSWTVFTIVPGAM